MFSEEQLRAYALALPGVAEAPHFDFASFRVPGQRGRIFLTVPPDGAHAHVFVEGQEAQALAAELPAAFEELWWGKRLRGVRVLLAAAPADQMREVVEAAWRRRAPKKLIAQLPRQSS